MNASNMHNRSQGVKYGKAGCFVGKMKRIVIWICVLCFCMAQMSKAEQTNLLTTVESTDEPVWEELSLGDRGDSVLQMQQRLTVLGFFYTAQDGIYGANTQSAVKTFEEYLRLLEVDEIERRSASMKASESSASEKKTGSAASSIASQTISPITTSSSEKNDSAPSAESTTAPLNSSTTIAASPSPEPSPTPTTIVDGVADVQTLEILFSDADALYRRDAQMSDQGMDITRIQRRLVALNYLNDEPDGTFGINTENAIKAFQRAYDMNETGVADRSLQRLLFSDEAIIAEKPVYNQLYLGMSGSDVKAVQEQLRLLGFMTANASGTYDAKTEEAVKQLEIYLHQLEASETDESSEPFPSATPTVKSDVDASLSPSEPANATSSPASAEPDSSLPTMTPGVIPVNPVQPNGDEGTLTADGFVPDGIMTAEMQIALLEEGIPVYLQSAKQGDVSVTTERVQRRLYLLGYLTVSGVDGIFGSGTKSAISAFQKRNQLEQTGVADQKTQSVLFSEDAVKAIKPYQIKVSTDDQRVYVYTHDDNDEYTILVKSFICSTGLKDTSTPKGTFTNTGPGARWHYFKKYKCWAQYAYYIDGDIMFHSVLYSDKDESTLNKGSVNRLGKRASHGCVRLQVEDAKWIWQNCAAGTKVIVY